MGTGQTLASRSTASPAPASSVGSATTATTRAPSAGAGFDAQSQALRPAPAREGAKAPASTTMMQDIALKQDPNERERPLLEQDADAASAWVQAAGWAIAIATTYAQTRPDAGNSMYGGRADALRHFLWNAYMAFMLGEDRARALADAHELPGPPADKNMNVDREMDFRNNAAGRRLGVFHRSQGAITRAFALSLMAAAGISYVNDGSLTVIDKRDDARWKLVPSNVDYVD
jgi:hypothetical protein